jgi:phospholipid/cholesterol/gamma-HCH transport system substrate-binding protein
LRRVEKIVSLFVVVATLLLATGFCYYLYHTAQRKGWFIPTCPFFTFAQSAEGLKVGDPVMLMGFEVGEITVIEAQPPGAWDRVFVGFKLRRPYYGYVWSDSKARIVSAGFLGARLLEVTGGATGQPTVYENGDRIQELLVDGKRVPFTSAPKGVYVPPEEQPSVTERAQRLLDTVEGALPNILAVTNRLNLVLDNASGLLTNLNGTVAELRPLVSNANVITANLRDPHGSLGEWLLPTNINTEAYALLGNLNTQLTATLLNVANITSNLNSQVQSNDQILVQISRLVVDTDNLVQGLKKHWLLSGIFRKDAAATNAPPATRTSGP